VLCLSGSAFAQDAELTAQEEGEVSAEGSAGTSSSEGQGGIKDRGVHHRPMGVSVMAYVPWYYGIGIGFNARFEIPIVHDGFISSINDQVSIEPSFSMAYRTRDYGSGYSDRLSFLDLTPAVYGIWSFHITPNFRPYGGIGIGYAISNWLEEDDYPGSDIDNGYFYWEGVAGLFYDFSDYVSFRCELGIQGPKAGLSIFF
jgi:opacity protein-like surface antigen